MKISSLNKKSYRIINFIQTLAIVIIVFVIFMFNFKIAIVPSLSMYPTLNIREFLFCKNTCEYDYDDIVIFHPSPNTTTYYVKRVVGLPGDKIEVKDGSLYRNDERIVSAYTNEDYIIYSMAAITVPDGEYFMMGDNRNNSGDSHVIGSIPKEQCISKVLFHYIPAFWDN